MFKHIIREVEPECANLSYYFDGDCFSAVGGEYGYTLFIIYSERYGRYHGLNVDEFNSVREQAEDVIDGFDDVKNGCRDYDGNKITYKDVMEDAGIDYNSRKCHALKTWAENADCDNADDLAAFLSILTGKTWDVIGVHGYCQGDYVQVMFCTEFYTENTAEICGEIWLGCAKEFCVIDLDENGNEINSCYGYIVADCEARTEEDCKHLVCEQAGIAESETVLQTVDGYRRVCKYKTYLPGGEEIDGEDLADRIKNSSTPEDLDPAA